jgi:RimJ/RimL family protein N-acetyltransferase
MIRFERTSDLTLVREIMTHPKVYPWISDDGSPSREEYRPHPDLLYVLVFDDEELLGLWAFTPQNSVTWEVHTCLLPGQDFHRARTAAIEMAGWVWANSDCHRIVTTVPRSNRAARLFARAAGMVEYGLNEKSFRKNGTLHDQFLFGISRPEEKACSQQ